MLGGYVRGYVRDMLGDMLGGYVRDMLGGANIAPEGGEWGLIGLGWFA